MRPDDAGHEGARTEDELQKECEGRRNEFAERARFHQNEFERYTRLARAENAKLEVMASVAPVGEIDFAPSEQKPMAISR